MPQKTHNNQSKDMADRKSTRKTSQQPNAKGSHNPKTETVVEHQAGELPQVQFVTIDDSSAGQRLDNFLITLLKGVPKTFIYRIIRSGEVRLNKGRTNAAMRVEDGDVVRIPPVRLPQKTSEPVAPAKSFPVLYEDNNLLVLNKPAGTAVHGGSGINYGLIEQLRQAMPQCKMLELVHRLDRDTSGAIIIAKKRSTLTALQQQFRERETGKTYLVLVKGIWKEGGRKGNKVIDVPLHKYLTTEGERRVRVTDKNDPLGKRSTSIVRLVEVLNGFSLLSVTIKTGRTHQIRVHLTHLDYPIVGDDKYGDFELNKRVARQYRFSRMFLHAYELRFEHPQLLKEMQLQAPLPQECQVFLHELKDEKNTTTSA